MKRIEDERREAHEKVPRKIHPFDLDAGAPRHFHVDERERNRNTCPALEHFVEKAVARIVVAIAISGKPFLVEQVRVQDVYRCFRCPRVLQAAACDQPFVRSSAHRVEFLEIRGGIERRAFQPRNHQCGSGKIAIRNGGKGGELRDKDVFHRAALLSRSITGDSMARRRSERRQLG
jgi:hypothetical protein